LRKLYWLGIALGLVAVLVVIMAVIIASYVDGGVTSEIGTEPHIVVAPGHDYWWQYPEVRSQITQFLRANFAPENN
jgi:hypothetical protein